MSRIACLFLGLFACLPISASPRGEAEIAEEKSSAVSSAPAAGAAVLNRGPDRGTGLLFLPLNAIVHYRGEYIDAGGTIEVFYTESEIFLSNTWIPGRCGGVSVLLAKAGDYTRYFYDSEDGWSAFFSFPSEYATYCEFITRFLQRLRFFISAADGEGIVPLPAVVETVF